MTISNIKTTFSCNVETVWNIVTSLDEYSWRKDLKKIEILDKNKFVEHTKNGYSTTFTITTFEPHKRYEFDIENENIRGHWVGLFDFDEKNTTIDFTENITVKKFRMKPFIKFYLKKQQNAYIKYLTEELKLKNSI